MKRIVYVIAGVMVLLMAGLVYAWSVMGSVINRELMVSQGALSLTFTMVMTTFCIGGFVAGYFSKKVKPRIYLLLSAGLFLVGFLLASMTGGVELLYVGIGILAGFGSGFAYNAVMSTVCAWYPDKPGLISGVLLMGFGLSSFLVGKIFVAVTPATDPTAWRMTFRVMAVVIGLILVVCSFFLVRPGADFVPPQGGKKKALPEPASDIDAKQMVKKASFWLYYAWATFVSAAGLALVSQANGIANQVAVNLDASAIATLVGMISICNGVGRVIFGGMFDRRGFRVTMMGDMIVFAVCGGILLLAMQSGSVVILLIGFILGGLAYGGVPPTNSAIISDFYGRTNYAVNFSLINTNLILASFASTIAGKLYDNSQSYVSTVVMILVVTLMGFLAFVFLKRPKKQS